MFRGTIITLKKIGKPMDLPPYKQVRLPYKEPPTEAEIQRERKKFMAKFPGPSSKSKSNYYEVPTVPDNMYTYGKEGMSLPIAIFKDQPDPVISAEHTYPGIYENKIACQHVSFNDMVRMSEEQAELDLEKNELEDVNTEMTGTKQKKGWDSPFRKFEFQEYLTHHRLSLQYQLRSMKDRQYLPYQKTQENKKSGGKKK